MNPTALLDDPTTIARQRAAAGATQLDKNDRDWYTRIDLDRLDQRLPCDCVVGQTFGDYNTGLATLFPAVAHEELRHGIIAIGEITLEETEPTYGDLNEAWRREIITRRYPEGHPED